VRRPGRVDVVHHRGERRALTASRGARHQYQAALLLSDPLQHRGKAELVDRLDPGRNDAEDEADRAALLEDIASEAADAGNAVRQIHFLGPPKSLALVVVED